MNKKISIFIILLTVTLFLGCTAITKRNINEKNINTMTITEKDEETIREYIDNKTGNDIVVSDEETYSAFKILGSSDNEIYLWVLKENESGGGGSVPLVLEIKKENNNLNILSYKMPGSGDDYGKDIKEMFPKGVQNKIFSKPDAHNEMISELQKELQEIKNK
ncbi:hypothetical protein K5V21_07750 [Clostridium sardiniense]|uniref:Lipoprotein n=1 Tax=Clostridium sardiniense TaxID=29369 RepID=A0ABS7KX17_CLOSR|nr:hypothetical protein [Clostridium sardiniense]MBY0755349.1 hypothetical protein [Clostridium sardiniense]MDQ0459795.1 vacuolar-type H+-ATPase subunit F/Vma7 [Clostridium sardiniense]